MRTRLEEAKAAAEISSKITEAETGTSKIGAGILPRLGSPAPIQYYCHNLYYYITDNQEEFSCGNWAG